jgi:crossover junction endodeoxyribonuclease RusA
MNDRTHWRVRADQVAVVRGAAFVLAKHAKVDKGCERVRITLHYRPVDRRRRDAINLAPTLKACEDGLVDARVVPDDTPEFIDPQMPVIEPWQAGQKKGLLWLEIERLL